MSLHYEVHIYHREAIFNGGGGGYAGTIAAFMDESDALAFCRRKNCIAASYHVIMSCDGWNWASKYLPDVARRYKNAHC